MPTKCLDFVYEIIMESYTLTTPEKTSAKSLNPNSLFRYKITRGCEPFTFTQKLAQNLQPFIMKSNADRQTDGRTDRQTDRQADALL